MKKKALKGKLALKKNVVSDLEADQVKGGSIFLCFSSTCMTVASIEFTCGTNLTCVHPPT